ncbi:TPA: hypothetical protein ACFP4A_000636 [Neisseria subflava]
MAKQKTVTVGCKLPNGLIIEVGGRSVELNGANASNTIGGHGITYNVDADFFNAWMEAHQDRDMVKNGFVFAHEDAKNTKAEAREKTGRARNAAVPAGAPFRRAGRTCRTGRIGGAHCFGHGSTTLFQRKLLLQNS